MNKIFAPAYFGKHNYKNYNEMEKELFNFLYEKEEIEYEKHIIDVDFLFSSELCHYFSVIFGRAFQYNKKIIIQSKNRKTLNTIKKSLKRLCINFKKPTMKKGKFQLEII